MIDLYPQESWNYVFGQASLRDRVGVFSFARYDPAFFGGERAEGWQTLMLKRSCKVLAHEIGRQTVRLEWLTSEIGSLYQRLDELMERESCSRVEMLYCMDIYE